MLQAPNIGTAAGAELRDVVLTEIPDDVRIGGQTSQEDAESLLNTDSYGVRARRTGYIQYIDPQYVLTLAREHDLVIRLLQKSG